MRNGTIMGFTRRGEAPARRLPAVARNAQIAGSLRGRSAFSCITVFGAANWTANSRQHIRVGYLGDCVVIVPLVIYLAGQPLPG